MGAAVQVALARREGRAPDLEITEAFNFVQPCGGTTGSIHLRRRALLAVVVVWLFLRDWRARLSPWHAAAVRSIPAFIGMYGGWFSITSITLLALSLVVRFWSTTPSSRSRVSCATTCAWAKRLPGRDGAADEISLAVLPHLHAGASVLPRQAALPGKFFKQFGWTAALAVFASLGGGAVLTPMMAAYILKPGRHQREPALDGHLRCRRGASSTAGSPSAATITFLMGSPLIPLLPTGFIPPDDNSQTQVYLELPQARHTGQTRGRGRRRAPARAPVAHVKGVHHHRRRHGGVGPFHGRRHARNAQRPR